MNKNKSHACLIHQLTTFILFFTVSTVVNASSLITQTDVSLFDSTGTGLIDQDNTFINQFPDITEPSITHSSELTNGSASLQVDLIQGSMKMRADTALPLTGPNVISSVANATYSDRLRLFGSGVEQTVNVQLVLELTGEVSGELGVAASLVYSFGGTIRNVLIQPSTHDQPFTFNDIISLDVFIPSVGAPFVSFQIALIAQSTAIGSADLSNSLNYYFVLPNDIRVETDSGLPLPRAPIDTDFDGILDGADNCPTVSNPQQLDADGDASGDACDEDDDNDGMPDSFELQYSLNPLDASDADTDADGDGYSNLEEYKAGTDPRDPNSVPSNNAMPWLPILLE